MKKYMICCGVLILAVLCGGSCGQMGAEPGYENEGSGEIVSDFQHKESGREGEDIESMGNEREGGDIESTGNKREGGDVESTESEREGGDIESTGNGRESGDIESTGNGRESGDFRENEGNTQTGESSINSGRDQTVTGALSVEGTKLVDGSGNPVQLKGISTHGLAWYPDYVNQECIRQLKEEWGINVFRLAMYTAEYGGYCSGGNKEELKTLVKNGVEYATDCGMYVIIDWHILSDSNPNTYLEEAKDFFGEMSETYADYNNVFYEICNEPNGGTSWSDIKSYAKQVIEVIRENDQDGIVLVGTPNWCQYVEQAAADPIDGYDNIMYTLHFYAATHKEDLRDSMVRAVEAGLPVFVSEYGICDASGSGGIDEYQANQWVDTLNAHRISYVAWNLSNKGETSAVIKSSCNKVSGFTEEDLSDSGRWLYKMLGGTGPGTADDTETKEMTSADETNQSGTSGSEKEAGNKPSEESAPSQGETKTTDGKVQESGLDIEYQIVNSWGQGQESYYQYTLTITNLTGAALENWEVHLFFNEDIALSNGWNGNYQVEGNVMTITSMDYNGHIDSSGSVDNIGFIVQGPEGLDIQASPAE